MVVILFFVHIYAVPYYIRKTCIIKTLLKVSNIPIINEKSNKESKFIFRCFGCFRACNRLFYAYIELSKETQP